MTPGPFWRRCLLCGTVAESRQREFPGQGSWHGPSRSCRGRREEAQAALDRQEAAIDGQHRAGDHGAVIR